MVVTAPLVIERSASGMQALSGSSNEYCTGPKHAHGLATGMHYLLTPALAGVAMPRSKDEQAVLRKALNNAPHVGIQGL